MYQFKTNFKEEIITDKKHRIFISTLPCASCGTPALSQCAHLKRRGMGYKEGDNKTLPLCCQRYSINGCHADSEKKEKTYFEPFGGFDKAMELAQALYENTGNREKCLELIRNFRCGMYL